jgi:hypothetical protein
MGFINDKSETINNVALFEVLNNLPKTRSTSSLESVTSKSKNLLSFLIDLLSVTCKDNAKNPRDRNKCEAAKILTQILIEFFPVLIRILKEGLAKAIKAGLACNTNFTLPNQNVKVKLKLKNLDYNGLLKINPNSEIGSTFYGKNATKDFNWYLNNLVQNGGNGNWAGIMDLNYSKPTEEIEMGLNPSYLSSGGKSFNDFIIDYTNSIEMISLENFMAKLTNKLTGSLTASLQNPPSLDKLISMEKVDALIEKINNSDPCKEEYQYDDSYFKFNNDEINKIETVASEKLLGVTNLDLGCGIVPATVDSNLVKNLFDEIRNSPPSKINNVINKSMDSINNNLTSNVPEADKQNAKLSLNKKLIEAVPKVLTDIALEPKVIALYQLSTKIVNGPLTPVQPPVGSGGNININDNLNVDNGFDFAKANRVFFEFVVRESLAALVEIIFNQAKKEIVRLVSEAVIKILKDRVKLKVTQLSFLTGGLVDKVLSSAPTPDTSKYI